MPAIEPGSQWGILGGVFDPFHIGHLNLAQGAKSNLSLDGVLLIPSFAPPHRAEPALVDFEQRLEMLERLATEIEWLAVSDIERQLEPPSYTYLVLKELTRLHGQTDFFLIIGADNLGGFTNWFRWQENLELAKLAVGCRPGFEIEDQSWLPADRVNTVEIESIDLSSTEVRNRLKQERSESLLARLVPPRIADYIVNNNLYK